MAKKKASGLLVKCKECGTPVGTVNSILNKIDNEWDPDEPTGWVQQKLAAGDLGVMTHYHISCKNPQCPKNGQEIAVLKLEFVSRDNATLEF